jgi:hypothetical protein
MISILLVLALALSPYSAQADRIRRVIMAKDQIVKVNTAIGVATIIQVPDQPTSLVVGNQDAFKVEFLDTAITVKPFSSSAKSNLYIYTDYRRFDVQLVTVQEPLADYVVYLEGKEIKPLRVDKTTSWKSVSVKDEASDLRLSLLRIGRISSSLFLDFEISSRKEFKVKPEWVWVTQGKKTVPIQRLVLSAFQGLNGAPVRAVAELLTTEFKITEPLRLEVRAPKLLKVVVPKVHP